MMDNRVKLMVAAVTALSISSAYGQQYPMSAGSMQESAPTDQGNGSKAKAHAQHGEKKPAETPSKTGGGKEMMPGMDHGRMSHEATPAMAGSMPGMNHDEPRGDASTQKQNMSGMDHGSGGMDHGDKKMQGGSAPPDARDPHAWSGGYTLDSGPYALPEQRQLGMADTHNFGELLDEHNFGGLLVDRLESQTKRNNTSMTYDWQAWYGQTYDRLLIRSEGDIESGTFKNARNELLWAHAITAYWDTQLGVRYDSGKGTDRGWLTFGVQGLAPYWLYVEANAYVNEQGRTAFRLETEYDLLLTQKLILQPRIEMNIYSRRDDTRDVSSGLSNIEAGLRLRYEIRRGFGPYVGIEWAGRFGSAADNIRAAGKDAEETRFVAGVRFWY
jgi:copper resistance protein B